MATLSQHLRVGLKPLLIVQTALVAPLSSAAVPAVYEWGTHAQSNYEYAVTRAVFAPTVGASQPLPLRLVGNAAAPQPVDLTLPAALFQPLAAGRTPPHIATLTAGPQLLDLTLAADLYVPPPGYGQGRVPPLTLGAPQLADLTQQGDIYAPNAYFAGASYPYRLAQGAPQQADLTLQAATFHTEPNVEAPVPALIAALPQAVDLGLADRGVARQVFPAALTPPAVAPPIPLIAGAPQAADLTLQAAFFKTEPNLEAKVPPLAVGAPQSVDLTLQGWVLAPLPAVPVPWSGHWFAGPPDAAAAYDGQWRGAVWASVRAPPPTFGQLGGFLGTVPQLADLTLQGDVYSPTPLASGSLVAPFAVPPQADPTQLQPQLFRPLLTPPAVAPFRLVSAAPQSVDLTLQGGIVEAAVTPVPWVPTLVAGAPQAADLTLQGWVRGTAQARQARVRPLVSGAPLLDLTQQGWVLGTAQEAVEAKVPALLFAAPQLADLTLQGWVVPPLVLQQLLALPFAPVFAAPQWVDLTIQGWVLGTAPVLQGRAPPTIFAAPQFVDLSLSVWWDASTEVRSVRIRPAPSGFSVTTRMSF